VGTRDTGPTKPGWGEGQLGLWLMRSVDLLQARPKSIAAIVIVVSAIAAVGAFRLEVETDFTRNFRQGSDVVRSYEFVETNLGGAGVWDVTLPAPATLDSEYIARVRKLEERLRDLKLPDPTTGEPAPALTKVISVVDAIDANEADRALSILTPELQYRGLRAAMPVFIDALLTPELDERGQGRLRIMLRARERQPAEQKRWLINEVTRISQEEFPADGGHHAPRDENPHAEREDHQDDPHAEREDYQEEFQSGAEVTGFFVLLTNLIESILRDQWTTFAISTAAISLMVFIGFRSWKYALIALIPNVVPIYIVMGLMGWLNLLGIADLKINMGAAMIAAVSMGMSVDSSIHYFASFRQARREGKSVHESLLVVQQSVGLAMIFSTAALIVGFAVLITSEFVPTIYFGALMSLAMLGGLAGNLVVLPLLLAWVEREPATTQARSASEGPGRVGQARAASADPRGMDSADVQTPVDNGDSNPRGSASAEADLTHPTPAPSAAEGPPP
jgi:predicted RND superfamily exporter protein